MQPGERVSITIGIISAAQLVQLKTDNTQVTKWIVVYPGNAFLALKIPAVFFSHCPFEDEMLLRDVTGHNPFSWAQAVAGIICTMC